MQFDVYTTMLNKQIIIVSPNEMNDYINTVIVAPVIKKLNDYITRPYFILNEEVNCIVLDQLFTLNKSQLKAKIGSINTDTQLKIKEVLQKMFI